MGLTKLAIVQQSHITSRFAVETCTCTNMVRPFEAVQTHQASLASNALRTPRQSHDEPWRAQAPRPFASELTSQQSPEARAEPDSHDIQKSNLKRITYRNPQHSLVSRVPAHQVHVFQAACWLGKPFFCSSTSSNNHMQLCIACIISMLVDVGLSPFVTSIISANQDTPKLSNPRSQLKRECPELRLCVVSMRSWNFSTK